MEPDELRRLIRRKIITGALPGEPAKTAWAGMGEGRTCAACDRRIKASDTEMELELSAGRSTVRLHRECFKIWTEECDHG